MALNINQFALSAVKGLQDLRGSPSSVIACQVDSSSAGGLVPGQCVKIVNTAGGVPNVVECSAATDDVFGVILYNIKNATFGVGDAVEIAYANGAVVYMEASAAIVPYARVMPVISGSKVATATTGNRIIGFALDKTAADGDLVRVVVQLPGALA